MKLGEQLRLSVLFAKFSEKKKIVLNIFISKRIF